MKRVVSFIMVLCLMLSILRGCRGRNGWSFTPDCEDYRNEYFAKSLKEQFPDYDEVIEYMPTEITPQAARRRPEHRG
jgi:hypothetical protein